MAQRVLAVFCFFALMAVLGDQLRSRPTVIETVIKTLCR